MWSFQLCMDKDKLSTQTKISWLLHDISCSHKKVGFGGLVGGGGGAVEPIMIGGGC